MTGATQLLSSNGAVFLAMQIKLTDLVTLIFMQYPKVLAMSWLNSRVSV